MWYFLLFLSGHFCLPFTKNGWIFSFSIHKETRRKSIGYTHYEITVVSTTTLYEGEGGCLLLFSQGRLQPCKASSWDQTSSSHFFPPFSCSSLHIPLNPLPPLFPLSASSAPLQASAFTSLLFILLFLQLPHPLTLSPRSYSQSAVPALLLLQGWSAAVRWCSASCWQKPFVEHWGGLRSSLLRPRCGGPNHLACPFRAWQRSCGRGRGPALGGSSSWSCGGGPWMVWRRCSAVTGPSGGGWAGPWWAPSHSLLLSRLLQQSDPLPTTGPPDGQVTPEASHGTWNHRLVMLSDIKLRWWNVLSLCQVTMTLKCPECKFNYHYNTS